jgi:CHRD domain
MTETTTKMTSLKVMAIVSSLVLASLGSMAILTQQPSSTIAAYAQQQSQTFTAKLSGKDEVPPVNTQATGTAQFQLSSDGKEINYDLSTTNLQGFMMAHIHKGKAGENGQPITSPLSIGKGKITSSDLQGALAGKQIPDLVDLMKNGETYANVHTQQNQNGEIRGQIMSG